MNFVRIGVLVIIGLGLMVWPAFGAVAQHPDATMASQPLKPAAPIGEVSILIDAQKRTLTILDDHKFFKKYRVAVGKQDSPTPIGNWQVLRMAKNWGSGFGSRFMLLDVPWGLYGIHGTNKPHSIGGFQSHGCIRMHNRDVEEIYPWIRVGTRVVITGNPFGRLHQPWKTAFRGHKGSDVVLIQERLRYWGLYQGKCDGIFGWSTEVAVKQFQKQYRLPLTGQIDEDDFRALGL
ncbi:MAG TPA: L,D-transpeptidase family protein [Bacillota bacterium]|nr:L,D-transpeptidase family protein [Bacillota bacterium]